MHGADNSVSGLIRAGRVTQGTAQDVEEAKLALAVAKEIVENSTPTLNRANAVGATLGRLTRRKLRLKFDPVDLTHTSALKPRQNKDAQMFGHGIGKTDELRPAGQKQLTRQGRTRVEGQAARLQTFEPAIDLRQRTDCVEQRISVQRPAARVKAGARRRSDDKLTMAKGARQNLVSHLFSESEEVLALACRAAFRQRRFIDVEGNVETIDIKQSARRAVAFAAPPRLQF